MNETCVPPRPAQARAGAAKPILPQVSGPNTSEVG
jgi:hypothetical protein